MSEVTRLFDRFQKVDPTPTEGRLRVAYDELRKLTAAKMAQEAVGHTLQPT